MAMEKNVQQSIRRKIKASTEILEQGENRKIKNEFLEKFTYCEVIAKELMRIYYRGKKNKRVQTEGLKLNLSVIKSAVKYTGMYQSEIVLNTIFSTEKRRNQKSCRELRNGISHALNAKDILELVERKAVLFGAMDAFLEMFTPAKVMEISQHRINKRKKPA